MNRLKNLRLTDQVLKKNIEAIGKILNNVRKFYDGRELINLAFKRKLFPLVFGNYYEEVREESPESEESRGEDRE